MRGGLRERRGFRARTPVVADRARGQATSETDLSPLVDAIYEAGVRPEAWTEFLPLLCTALGAQSSVLHIYNLAEDSGASLWRHGIPEEAIADYPSWVEANPHRAAVAPLQGTGLVLQNTPLTRDEYLKTDYFNHFSRPYLPTYAACGACIYANGPTYIGLGVDRALGLDSFSTGEAYVLTQLVPHLQRAMVIHRRLADAELEQATNLETLNGLGLGVILLSRRGTVTVMNDMARAMISATDTLKCSGQGQLTSTNVRDDARLQGLIASACKANRNSIVAGGGAMRLGRSGTSLPLELFAAPLRLRKFALSPDMPTSVLFVRDPDSVSLPVARLQQLYDLTLAEARVAQRLGSGESVSDLSVSLGIAVSTVRTHIRHLLDKTGAKNLSDLTRRIAGLPPFR